MNKLYKQKGKLNSYIKLPVWFSILLIIMDINIYFVNIKAGIIGSAYISIYIISSVIGYYIKRQNILKEMISFAASYSQVQKALMKELAIPFAIIDVEGRLLWGNEEFMNLLEKEKPAKKSITNIFPEVTKEALPKTDNKESLHVIYDDKNFKIDMKRISIEDFDIVNDNDDFGLDTNALIAFSLFDETEINRYIKENKEQRLIVGLIYIDNYEEALDSIDEVKRSLLLALVDRKINKYGSSIDGIIKKVEKDKFLLVFKNKYLAQMQADKFSLLSEVRTINIGNEISVTLSIGLGVNAETYIQSYDYARAAIDLALGRGGDQAVVKDGERISYYGGKHTQIEKSTRVKARVKAHALKELIEAKDKVVIMGHSIGDVDSLGSAIGIYRIAKTLNKKAHIVVNEVTTTVRPLMDRFINNPDYEANMFVKNEEAKEIVDYNTLLVIVDVNRPTYTECKELLDLTKTIVVLDHHRQGGESVEHAVLSYIETYASSTCEMVAEILQYIGGGLKIKQVEADAMYAGIMLDTNNFLTKTGVRTFEAAAFLRRNGADVTRIRKIFRNDEVSYKARAEAVRNSEIYEKYYAIAVSPTDGIASPTVVGAQVANELLNIVGIKASFVFTEFNDKIYISARSIDEANVQIIMERLGGGGHLSVAGAQLSNCTMKEAINILKITLDKMIAEGDL